MTRATGLGLILLCAVPARADAPAVPPGAELSAALRNLLLKNLPEPLYEAQKDWGRTVTEKVIKLPRRQIVIRHGPKNDGHWRKIRVNAMNPRDNLTFELRELASAAAGKLTFRLHAGLPARVVASQEHWESGLRLYDVSVQARARLRVTLDCEASTRVEFQGFAPDFVATMKVTRAETGFDDLVCEHVGGVGGEAAEIIGDVARGVLKRWKPDFEQRLLEQANQAILKAGQEKEVRLSLSKLFEMKPKDQKP